MTRLFEIVITDRVKFDRLWTLLTETILIPPSPKMITIKIRNARNNLVDMRITLPLVEAIYPTDRLKIPPLIE
jgi:hypothetical protein